MQQLPDDIPDSLRYLLALIFGAGGVHYFRVWLENRRLAKREFRELLLDRIRDLETTIDHMQKRMGSLRVEMAHLEVENGYLRRKIADLEADLEARSSDIKPRPSRRSSDEPSQ